MIKEDPRYADSIVGSPDYMAPEVLRAKPYTYSVDYWSLGCILFEFLAGFPPFTGETAEETWTNLKKWTTVLARPHYDKPDDQIFNLTDVAWDAITRYVETPYVCLRARFTENRMSQPYRPRQSAILDFGASPPTPLLPRHQVGYPPVYGSTFRSST